MVKLEKVVITKKPIDGKIYNVGDVIAEVEMDEKNAKSYFEFITSNPNRKPQTKILRLKDKTFGLDKFGKLQKGGEYNYNNFGKLVKKQSTSSSTKSSK